MSNWISYSPHIKSKLTTTKIYLLMIALLLPSVACACVLLDYRPFLLVAVSVLTALISDVCFKLCVEKNYEFTEISAIFIGLIIGLSCPSGASFYMPIIATIFSIIFIRDLAGGIGKNFVSEIAVAVVLSSLIFGTGFNSYIDPASGLVVNTSYIDRVLSGDVAGINIVSSLFGGNAGLVGDSGLLFIIIAGVVLCALKVIDFRVPVAVIASTLLFTLLFYSFNVSINITLTAEVMLCAFFVAPDFAVVPTNKYVKWVYGLLIGFIGVLLTKVSGARFAIMSATIIVGLISAIYNGMVLEFRKRSEVKNG